MKQPISIIVNTKNAAKTLERALDSVKFADEIIVVDMQSDDKTVSIAKKYTSKVFNHPDKGYADPARNFAIKKATHDWVLIVDADEVIPVELQKKVSELLSLKAEVSCYYIPRKNIIFGKWVEKTGWWPDFQPRLFKKDAIHWKDGVHSQPIITGNSEYLPNDPDLAIIHYNYDSVSDYLQRLDRYTGIAAKEQLNEKKSISGADLITSFSDELLRRLFLDKGVEEGIHGIGLSFLQSMYQMVVSLKTWELQKDRKAQDSTAEVLAVIQKLQGDLAYWVAEYQVQQTKGVSKIIWKSRRKLKL